MNIATSRECKPVVIVCLHNQDAYDACDTLHQFATEMGLFSDKQNYSLVTIESIQILFVSMWSYNHMVVEALEPSYLLLDDIIENYQNQRARIIVDQSAETLKQLYGTITEVH
jgi:hypothetical protein